MSLQRVTAHVNSFAQPLLAQLVKSHMSHTCTSHVTHMHKSRHRYMSCTFTSNLVKLVLAEPPRLHPASHCNILQQTVTHTTYLELTVKIVLAESFRIHPHHTASHCKILQHTATHCNTLKLVLAVPSRIHAATRCNTLQHSATHAIYDSTPQHTETHCSTLQQTASLCNAPQHTAPHYNPPRVS